MATLALMRVAPLSPSAVRVSSSQHSGNRVWVTSPKTGAANLSSPGCSRPRLGASHLSKPGVISRTHVIAHGQGQSLHIGLNFVDPGHYNGWDGELAGCINDAKAMIGIAAAQGIKSRAELIDGQATREKVLEHLRQASGQLKAGDYFLLTYSGHGGQVVDVTGDEEDQLDETWCLYDGQLIDDELYLELSKFAEGVRILVLSDSCHSGTMIRAGPPPSGDEPAGKRVVYRQLPPVLGQQVYEAHADFYDNLQKQISAKARQQPLREFIKGKLATLMLHPRLVTSERFRTLAGATKASILLISGCQDYQFSQDGASNGLFTENLLKVWGGGAFQGSHRKFHAQIARQIPRQANQLPNLFALGPDVSFAQQRPFTV